METFIVPRSGNAPLKFAGDCIAVSDGASRNGQEHNRWHAITLYTVGGTHYVLHVAYRTAWQGEEPHDTAVVLEGELAIAQALRDYVPEQDVQGYPPGSAHATKQAHLLAEVRRRWRSQVAELLLAANIAEGVTL